MMQKLLSCLRPRGGPRLAMATCVRNEARFLAAHLCYHRALGVARAYVFLDRCTDSSERIANSFPWVRTIRLDPRESAQVVYPQDRQIACMNHALNLARDDRCDWLLVIDVDEFAYGAEPSGTPADVVASGSLTALLRQVPNHVAVVRLRPKELVPMKLPAGRPFWKHRYFQFEQPLRRELLDPVSGQRRQWSGFLGQSQGKTIVRTSLDVQAYNTHRWVPNQERRYPKRPDLVPLPTIERGFHYHFIVVSQAHWREKYGKFAGVPDVWRGGRPVEWTKQVWKQANARLSSQQLDGYFHRWIEVPQADLQRLAETAQLQRESVVEDVLKAAGCLAGDRLRMPKLSLRSRLLRQPLATGELRIGSPGAAEPRGTLKYRPAHMSADALSGFHDVELSRAGLFRWTKQTAALRLALPPRDYCMTVHLGAMQSRWRGRMQVVVDHRPLRAPQLTTRQGKLSVVICRDYFADSPTHLVQLFFTPTDTSAWSMRDDRELGAPVLAVEFQPTTTSQSYAA